jgi:hypothetical protein
VFAEICDFNGAAKYFAKAGASEWAQIDTIVNGLVPRLQPSRQAKIEGTPIFDPKATNRDLSEAAAKLGWSTIPMPTSLGAFGVTWDSGKNGTLVEWQFSNYPFLANNVIRTEVAFRQKIPLEGVKRVEALIVITKCGVFPSSNSSLYYEQARAQLEIATKLALFDLPVRLVGLSIPPGVRRFKALWGTYKARTSRTGSKALLRQIDVTWTGKSNRYGAPKATFGKPR